MATMGKQSTRNTSSSTKTNRTTPVKSLSLTELQNELRTRQREVGKLQRKRERLYGLISEVDKELAAFGALSSSGAVLRRPRNEMNLVESLAKTLKGKTMSVTEVTQVVQENGYMTTAANFRTIVNQALIRETKIFKKVSRGRYTAR
jgi:hypothetical protein